MRSFERALIQDNGYSHKKGKIWIHTHILGEHHAKARVRQPHTKDCQSHQQLEEAKGGFFESFQRKHGLAD